MSVGITGIPPSLLINIATRHKSWESSVKIVPGINKALTKIKACVRKGCKFKSSSHQVPLRFTERDIFSSRRLLTKMLGPKQRTHFIVCIKGNNLLSLSLSFSYAAMFLQNYIQVTHHKSLRHRVFNIGVKKQIRTLLDIQGCPKLSFC